MNIKVDSKIDAIFCIKRCTVTNKKYLYYCEIMRENNGSFELTAWTSKYFSLTNLLKCIKGMHLKNNGIIIYSLDMFL